MTRPVPPLPVGRLLRIRCLVAAGAMLVGGVACGRANPRVETVTRTEGDFVIVSTLGYDKDGRVANVRRVEGNPDEAPDDFTDLTWVDGHLTQVERTITRDDFVTVATTTIEYAGDLVTTAATATLLLRPDEDPRPLSDEAIVIDYDDQLFEGLTRTFEDRDRNKADTTLVFTYDVQGVIEVREDSKFVNNGAPDQEISRVTNVEYVGSKPSKLTVVENEGRATTFDIVYKGGVLELMDLAIPALDEFNNELTAEGRNNYRFDSDDRLIGVDIESDLTQAVTFEIEYVDGDDEANGIDLMPAGAVPLPLWDMRGNAYDGIDARTQVPRFVGAAW